MIFAGSPAPPPRSRRSSTLPREPVPPVINTRLPSSTCIHQPPAAVRRSSDCVIGGPIFAHRLDHRPPRPRLKSGARTKPATVEPAIAQKAVVALDRYTGVVHFIDKMQKLEFADRRGRDVP